MTAYQLFQKYSRLKVFLAGRHDYNIEADYTAYSAMARGDEATIKRVHRARMQKAGLTAKQVKFAKVKDGEHGDKVKLSYAWCLRRYQRENERYIQELYATREDRAKALAGAPLHLVSVDGMQDKDKADSLVATYSADRPKRVETPFGAADNSEVF